MRTLCLAMVVAFLATPAVAQEQRGSIEGLVKDSSGGLLPGVTVEATSPTLVGIATAVTDDRGVYRFPALRPGVYALQAQFRDSVSSGSRTSSCSSDRSSSSISR